MPIRRVPPDAAPMPRVISGADSLDQLSQSHPAPRITINSSELTQALCEIATNAWKAQCRLSETDVTSQTTAQRRLVRNIEGIFDALARLRVVVKDHTGDSYDYGMPLTVVASEARRGIAHEIVVETIRPSITLADQLIQRGTVVIAVPTDEEGSSA